jgi:hypothetical protein
MALPLYPQRKSHRYRQGGRAMFALSRCRTTAEEKRLSTLAGTSPIGWLAGLDLRNESEDSLSADWSASVMETRRVRGLRNVCYFWAVFHASVRPPPCNVLCSVLLSTAPAWIPPELTDTALSSTRSSVWLLHS